ncbi:MAG: DUF4129 domain-containing protein, partial [Chloroflexi bacterium]|nr:DUF4129 domain-containing protein [Chloroflexota bacterium]
RVEEHLRTFTYSTRVPVPPSERDWVDFLLFDSKQGYCDYYATAMTVMLRSVGIPARVATGYVTGEFDPLNQSYLVTEQHAHTWTEVYFPGYGWISFEPSANRPVPPRLESPLIARTEDDIMEALESDLGADAFLEEDELLDDGGFVPLPAEQGGPAYSLGLVALGVLFTVLVGASLTAGLLWFVGTVRLPAFARPYGQVVRLATWCGFGPRSSQTPFEYTKDLVRVVPAASEPLAAIADAYVAGTYGGQQFDGGSLGRVRAAGARALRMLFRSLATRRWRVWLTSRLRELTGPERER